MSSPAAEGEMSQDSQESEEVLDMNKTSSAEPELKCTVEPREMKAVLFGGASDESEGEESERKVSLPSPVGSPVLSPLSPPVEPLTENVVSPGKKRKLNITCGEG